MFPLLDSLHDTIDLDTILLVHRVGFSLDQHSQDLIVSLINDDGPIPSQWLSVIS